MELRTASFLAATLLTAVLDARAEEEELLRDAPAPELSRLIAPAALAVIAPRPLPAPRGNASALLGRAISAYQTGVVEPLEDGQKENAALLLKMVRNAQKPAQRLRVQTRRAAVRLPEPETHAILDEFCRTLDGRDCRGHAAAAPDMAPLIPTLDAEARRLEAGHASSPQSDPCSSSGDPGGDASSKSENRIKVLRAAVEEATGGKGPIAEALNALEKKAKDLSGFQRQAALGLTADTRRELKALETALTAPRRHPGAAKIERAAEGARVGALNFAMAKLVGEALVRGRQAAYKETSAARAVAAGSLALTQSLRLADDADFILQDVLQRKDLPAEVLLKPKKDAPPVRVARGGWQAALETARQAVDAACRARALIAK